MLGARKPKLRTYARTEGRVSGEVAAQGRRYKGAKVDLCRIHTDRIRDLSSMQIATMQRRLGAIPKKERIRAMFSSGTKRTGRGLLQQFLFNLWGYYTTPIKEDPKANEIYRRNYGENPKYTNREIRESYKLEAERAEHRIWDAQVQAGCKISGVEETARDAAREGRRGAANRIRRRR